MRSGMMVRPLRLTTILGTALLLHACGGSSISRTDRETGAEQHPQLLAEFGGAYKGDESPYVAAVGEKVAAAAGLSGQCTFTLVNSDVVNAFAVPGCYIYVTRGLLAIVNSEGELASVLAHEVGHIAGEHSERQQRRSIWRTIGVVAVGALTGSERLSRLASSAANFFTLRYSRKHEYEADDLGLRYLEKAGYDPFASVDMLAALQRNQAFQLQARGVDDANSIPEWVLTHPLTENRIKRAAEEAAAEVGRPGTLPERELPYLRHVDGLLYGDDPEQGFVLGRRFAHPSMRIAFEAPPGFTLTNSPSAVLIEGTNGTRGEFSGGQLPPGGLKAYAEDLLAKLVGDAPVEVVGAAPLQAHGVPGLVVQAAVQSEHGPMLLSLAAYAGGNGAAYHFLLASDPKSTQPEALGALFRSFTVLSPAEVASLRPRTIRVHQVRPGETLRSLAGLMASDRPLAQLLVLNGRSQDQPLRPGEMVKLIAWKP